MARSVFLFIIVTSLALTPASFGAAKRLGATAPNFTLPTRTGPPASLQDFRGKVVLVDFWASWCGPCRQSFPWMSSMIDKHASQGLVIVSIDLDKNREAADEFLAKYRPPFIVAFDPAGSTAEAFDVNAMPSSFLVNRDGRIVYAHEGFELAKADSIEDQIKEALSK
jgi:peroxiredoxin